MIAIMYPAALLEFPFPNLVYTAAETASFAKTSSMIYCFNHPRIIMAVYFLDFFGV